MLKQLALVSVLATAAASASAQAADTTGSTATQAPAPVVRSYQSSPASQAAPAPPPAGQGPEANPGPYSQQGQGQGPWDSRGPMARRWRQNRPDDGQEAMQRPAPIQDSQPVAGAWLRSRSTSVIKTISATPQGTEIRVEHGVLNVSVHHPSQHISILVDLPGGQTSLLKDGLYTFNADTNTVRVLRGEAAAFPNAGKAGVTPVSADAKGGREKGIKVKEDHQISFVGSATPGGDRIKAVDAYPYELATDLLPASGDGRQQYANYSGEDGPYGYPYYAGGYGYPYGYYPGYYGYPYGYGIGIGYYGGFGGGFRGGYRGGGFRR